MFPEFLLPAVLFPAKASPYRHQKTKSLSLINSSSETSLNSSLSQYAFLRLHQHFTFPEMHNPLYYNWRICQYNILDDSLLYR